MATKSVCLAITGASGFVYGERLLQCLLAADCEVHLLMSDAAREVARLEHDRILPEEPSGLAAFLRAQAQTDLGKLYCYGKRDWLSPVASGSAKIDAMVVCPCSTGTLSAIANGASTNLIERAATVALKEHRRLIIVPRETPMSALTLEHMHKLALLGVRMLPAAPGFYHKPQTINDMIDFIVARILQHLDLPHQLIPSWGVIPE